MLKRFLCSCINEMWYEYYNIVHIWSIFTSYFMHKAHERQKPGILQCWVYGWFLRRMLKSIIVVWRNFRCQLLSILSVSDECVCKVSKTQKPSLIGQQRLKIWWACRIQRGKYRPGISIQSFKKAETCQLYWMNEAIEWDSQCLFIHMFLSRIQNFWILQYFPICWGLSLDCSASTWITQSCMMYICNAG